MEIFQRQKTVRSTASNGFLLAVTRLNQTPERYAQEYMRPNQHFGKMLWCLDTLVLQPFGRNGVRGLPRG
jgi:hypothetical protein